jgi:hypothetical protein
MFTGNLFQPFLHPAPFIRLHIEIPLKWIWFILLYMLLECVYYLYNLVSVCHLWGISAWSFRVLTAGGICRDRPGSWPLSVTRYRWSRPRWNFSQLDDLSIHWVVVVEVKEWMAVDFILQTSFLDALWMRIESLWTWVN